MRAGRDLRSALLEASLALIADGGVGALSMREVARRAGVTHGAPYHHFADRAAVLAALADQGFTQLEQTMRAAVDAAVDAGPVAQFEACGRGYVAFAVASPAHFRVMSRPELTGTVVPPSALGAFRVLVECVAACQAAGIARELEAMDVVLAGWSTAHGLAALWIDGPLRTITPDPAAAAARVGAAFGTLLAATARNRA